MPGWIEGRRPPYDRPAESVGLWERIARRARYDGAWPWLVVAYRDGAIQMIDRLAEEELDQWRTVGGDYTVRELVLGVAAWMAVTGPSDWSLDRFRREVAMVGRFMDGRLSFERCGRAHENVDEH